jgi:hypothetical protein
MKVTSSTSCTSMSSPIHAKKEASTPLPHDTYDGSSDIKTSSIPRENFDYTKVLGESAYTCKHQTRKSVLDRDRTHQNFCHRGRRLVHQHGRHHVSRRLEQRRKQQEIHRVTSVTFRSEISTVDTGHKPIRISCKRLFLRTFCKRFWPRGT